MNTYKEQQTRQDQKDEIEIDLGQLLGVLWSKIWIILLVGLAAAVMALLVTKLLITPTYTSNTKVYVLNRASVEAGLTAADLTSSTQLTKDYQQLILSRTVLEQVIENQKLKMTFGELSNKIIVTSQTETRILSIEVSDEDPKVAQNIANEIREVSSQHIQQVMDIESVNTVDEANLPVNPTSPNTLKNTMLGGLLGLIIIMGIIVVIFMLDDRIRTPEEAEKYLGLSVIGAIPIIEENEYGIYGKKNKKSGKAIKSKKG